MSISDTKLSSVIFIFTLSLFSALVSFPAAAANLNFPFIEFNIAFVLGVSLPVILALFYINRLHAVSIRTPLLLTATLLLLLFCIAYLSVRNDYIVLTLTAAILQLNCYWAVRLQATDTNNDNNRKGKWLQAVYFLLLFIFLAVLWLGIMTESKAWMVFSVLQVSFYITNVSVLGVKARNIQKRFWLLVVNNIVFSAVVYFYLSQQLPIEFFVAIAVLSYTIAMVSSCWQAISLAFTSDENNEPLSTSENVSLDPATNLPSYQFALNKFEHRVKHHTSSRYAAITFKPINFQQVNSVLGHHNSDILLLQLAYCLQKSIESDDELFNFSSQEQPVRVARLQGLHFLVVIDLAKSKYDDEVVIEQLCKKLANAVPGPMSFKSFSLFFKLVFGVAFVGKYSSNVSEVIACAEDALLQADKEQKLVCFFAQELAIFNEQQLQKMERLKQDILSEEINWQVQPQINMASKQPIAFELLLSWQYQSNNRLNFNEVMLIAQQSGDAYLLCQKMITQAFVYLQELQKSGAIIPVAIKISRNCILEPDLVDYIEQQASSYKIDCQYLLLEIEEEMLLSAAQDAKASIEQLKSLGIKIAIDEFSGSYEALRYLRRMAVSEIKINCQALAQAEAGSSDKAIINALINLTRKMDLPLIGTNINNSTIEKMFLSMGGEYAQGKHYSTGITLQGLNPWLNSWYQQYPPSVQ